jgi:hypothetical protein
LARQHHKHLYITDWLDKSCSDALNDDLSDIQELIPPTEDMLKRDTSIYDFPDADLESQVSHTTLTPNICTSKFPVFHIYTTTTALNGLSNWKVILLLLHLNILSES